MREKTICGCQAREMCKLADARDCVVQGFILFSAHQNCNIGLLMLVYSTIMLEKVICVPLLKVRNIYLDLKEGC